MGFDFKKRDLAAGRIYLEACKLLASDGGIRTAEGMLTQYLESNEADWPRGYEEAEDRSAVVTLAFFRRLETALERCGNHLGLHLMLEKVLKSANHAAGTQPLQPEAIPRPTDPEALRKRELDQHRLLDVAEVADTLQCTERRVRTAVKGRQLKCVELGPAPQQWRFRRADVDRYIGKLAGDQTYGRFL